MPTWLKGSAKFIFAVPFTFHSFNGVRHLAWDVGYGELFVSSFGGMDTRGRTDGLKAIPVWGI